MDTKPLYLVLITNGRLLDPAVLQIRTNIDHLESYKFERNNVGEYVLKVPEPIITIATGEPTELLNLVQKTFGKVATVNLYYTYNWTDLGNCTYAYKLQ